MLEIGEIKRLDGKKQKVKVKSLRYVFTQPMGALINLKQLAKRWLPDVMTVEAWDFYSAHQPIVESPAEALKLRTKLKGQAEKLKLAEEEV